MKKIIRITMGVMLAMSLVACGKSEKDNGTNSGVSTEAVVENSAETVTEEANNAATEQNVDDSEMLTEEEVNRALTNYIHAKYGDDFGEDVPEGTSCYWFVNPLEGNTYACELHSYTGSIEYYYVDPYTGKTDVCELTPASDDPQYVTTVNFNDYK